MKARASYLLKLAPRRIKEVKELVIKTVSPKDVIAAGGADKYAMEHGVDPRTAKVSGWVRISRAETDRMLEMLRERG